MTFFILGAVLQSGSGGGESATDQYTLDWSVARVSSLLSGLGPVFAQASRLAETEALDGKSLMRILLKDDYVALGALGLSRHALSLRAVHSATCFHYA